MGILADRREFFDEPAMALMLGDMPTDSYSMFQGPAAGQDKWFGLVHADGVAEDLGERLSDLSRLTGAFLVGGITASRGERPQFAGEATGGDISGVLFSEAVPVVTGLSQGCLPIGPAHTITACDRHIAITSSSQGTGTDSPDIETMSTGASVSLEQEMIKVSETQAEFQAATNLYSKSLSMMRTALGKSGS